MKRAEVSGLADKAGTRTHAWRTAPEKAPPTTVDIAVGEWLIACRNPATGIRLGAWGILTLLPVLLPARTLVEGLGNPGFTVAAAYGGLAWLLAFGGLVMTGLTGKGLTGKGLAGKKDPYGYLPEGASPRTVIGARLLFVWPPVLLAALSTLVAARMWYADGVLIIANVMMGGLAASGATSMMTGLATLAAHPEESDQNSGQPGRASLAQTISGFFYVTLVGAAAPIVDSGFLPGVLWMLGVVGLPILTLETAKAALTKAVERSELAD